MIKMKGDHYKTGDFSQLVGAKLTAAMEILPQMTILDKTEIEEKEPVSLSFIQVTTKGTSQVYPWVRRPLTTVELSGENLQVYDCVIAIKCKGRQLLMVTNEPGAPRAINGTGEEIHPVLRHPLQISIEEWDAVINAATAPQDIFFQIAIKILGIGPFMELTWKAVLQNPTLTDGVTLVASLTIKELAFEQLCLAISKTDLAVGIAFTNDEIKTVAHDRRYASAITLA